MPNPHPVIVHFAIGLFCAAIVLEVAAYFLKSKLMSQAGLVNSGGAAVAALLAVITGLMAKPLDLGGPAVFVLESHETMGYVVLAFALVFAALKFYGHHKQTDRLLTPTIAVGLLGLVFTIVAAHEGGELVYRYGVGVRREAPAAIKNYPYGKPFTAPVDSTADSVSSRP